MPKGIPVPIHIQQKILLSFDQYRRGGDGIMLSCARISEDLSREDSYVLPAKAIWNMLQRLRPTTDIAKMYLKAKAMKLVRRIVKKANVSEAIDLLSRSDMGVIAPAAKIEGGGGGGFFLSVEVDTCGAVKVGAAAGVSGQLSSSADSLRSPAVSDGVSRGQLAAFDPFAGVVGEWNEPTTSRTTQRIVGRGETAQSALDRARAKIAASRRPAKYQGHASVQGADGDPEEEDVTVTP